MSQHRRKHQTVLLVEDNPKDELLTLRALKRCGLSSSIHVVRDGSEALDYMFGKGEYADRNICDLPIAVLLDLKMPKIDGLEVLRRLRADERTKRVVVVIFTSSDETKDILAGYSMNANSFVCKPIEIKEFDKAVAQIGIYWSSINETPPKEIGCD